MNTKLIYLINATLLTFTNTIYAEKAAPPARGFESDKVYLEKVIFRLGSASATVDVDTSSGGVVGFVNPEDSGLTLNMSAIFTNDYSPAFKPYIEFTRLDLDDRRYNIVGFGVRHDYDRSYDEIGYYIAGGLGFASSIWEKAPFPGPSAGLAGNESFTISAQAGLDYYLTDHIALDLNARYDLYNQETTVIENSTTGATSTINDDGTFSVLVGIVYEFASNKPATHARKDSDGDGVLDDYDQCLNTLPHVPVNDHGCPQNNFTYHLTFEYGIFRLNQLVNQPTFDTVGFLKKHPDYNIQLSGCRDQLTDPDKNSKKTYFAATLAEKLLLEKHISDTRININEKGIHKPVSDVNKKDHLIIDRCVYTKFSKEKST